MDFELQQVIILAMKDMNIAKLTSDDLPLFIAITYDLFPGVNVPTVDYEEMNIYITQEAVKLKLQVKISKYNNIIIQYLIVKVKLPIDRLKIFKCVYI